MRFVLPLAVALVLAPLVSAQEPKGAPLPRRMLFVHVGGYPYLNPLTSGASGGASRTRDTAGRFAAVAFAAAT